MHTYSVSPLWSYLPTFHSSEHSDLYYINQADEWWLNSDFCQNIDLSQWVSHKLSNWVIMICVCLCCTCRWMWPPLLCCFLKLCNTVRTESTLFPNCRPSECQSHHSYLLSQPSSMSMMRYYITTLICPAYLGWGGGGGGYKHRKKHVGCFLIFFLLCTSWLSFLIFFNLCTSWLSPNV